jgi:uncharacterized membrane protein
VGREGPWTRGGWKRSAIARWSWSTTIMVLRRRRARGARRQRRATRERLSTVLYLVAIPLALIIIPWLACALYAAVATLWFVPDRRMEKIVAP